MTARHAATRRRHTANIKLAALYLRISKDREGREHGVDRQRKECSALAARLGVTIVETYTDNDRSASTNCDTPRPDYDRMMADAKAGKFGMIIAYTSGRLTRRPHEHEGQIELAREYGVRFEFVASPSFDLYTSAGRRIARTLAAQDTGEAEDISERTTNAKNQARLLGKRLGGCRPMGYERDGFTVRPEEAELIDAAIIRVVAGASCRGIAAQWDTVCPRSDWTRTMVEKLLERNPATLSDAERALFAEARDRVGKLKATSTWSKLGEPEQRAEVRAVLASVAGEWTDQRVPTGRPWNSSTVRTILCNPRNAGLVPLWTSAHYPDAAQDDQGDVIEAQWPAIVTVDQWRAAHAVLTDPARLTHESNSLKWVGSALYRCGVCNGEMRNSGTKRHNGEAMAVYRCRANGHCAMPAGPADAAVLASVAALLARDGAGLLSTGPAVDVPALQAQANTHRARLRELADEREDDKITKEAYYRMRDRRQAKLDAVERQLATVGAGSVLTGIADAPDPVAAFRASTVDRQRAIVDDLMVVTIMPGTRGRPARGVDGVDLDRVRIVPRRRVNGPADVAA